MDRYIDRHMIAHKNRDAAWHRSQEAIIGLDNFVYELNANWRDIHETLYSFTSTFFENLDYYGKLIMYGNGGSAADCDHIVGEFRSKFLLNRRSIDAIALSDSIATVTAIGNDFGYEHVFSRQLFGIATSYDSVIALSTSGNSANIENSLSIVRRKFPDINSLIITGKTNKQLPDFRHHIQIPIEYKKENVARIQEMTMFVLHTMCHMFDLFYESYEYGY